MSSSTFTHRWTSVNDLTTNNKPLNTFFLQSSNDTNPFTFTIRPSQSLVSLVETSSPAPPPVPPRPSTRTKTPTTSSSSSRVADIINRFESQTKQSMTSPTNRNAFFKQSEENSSTSKNQRIVVIETLRTTIKPKPQPIIVYERITNHDRTVQSRPTPPPIPPKTPMTKTWLQSKVVPPPPPPLPPTTTTTTVESDTDSAIQTMAVVANNNLNDSIAISRSNTTDSTCSSSSSTANSTVFKRACSSPPPSPPSPIVSTFSRPIPVPTTPTTHSETFESSLPIRFCASEINIADQFRRLSSPDASRSETNLPQALINTNLPLKYKRDSFYRLYGPDALQQHGHHTSKEVVLEDDIDPPFSPRIVTVKKNKSVTDEYELLEFLGRGKFGEVKKCRERSTKHLLAAKFIQIHKEQDRIEAHNEIEIMKALQHIRLLQLYDAFESKTDICLIMELITGGELFERVIDDDFILTERLCELYMMQICEGVSFMHSCNIIHLDMKPENILCLNRDGHRIKIIDFGLARKFDPTKQLKVLFGTPEFVAPEVINFDRVGYGTDMWSVGVICYVLLSGLSPFMGENDNDTYANINRANYDFDDEAFTDISDEAKDFISKLLIKNKEKRLQAKQCLAHPWLTRRPKLASTPKDEETAEKKLSTKKLRRFVIRRRWQKAVNALLALKRMGMTL